MGATLLAYQQARWHPCAGLVLIGYSGRGLPEVLDPEELAVAGDADKIRASIVALSRARFGRPLPAGGTSTSEMLVGPTPPDEATTAIEASGSALLAMCGLTSIIPGSHTAELTAVDVPVLLAVAENDIVGPPHEVPGYFPASPDVTLHVVRQAFHNSNIAPTRQALWDRIAAWTRTLPA
jgi:pimeloyl-ACP methyl ester carboxylesterase